MSAVFTCIRPRTPAERLALGVGIVTQTIWNFTGGADLAEGAMKDWLD